jgi:hypothetical protein
MRIISWSVEYLLTRKRYGIRREICFTPDQGGHYQKHVELDNLGDVKSQTHDRARVRMS